MLAKSPFVAGAAACSGVNVVEAPGAGEVACTATGVLFSPVVSITVGDTVDCDCEVGSNLSNGFVEDLLSLGEVF